MVYGAAGTRARSIGTRAVRRRHFCRVADDNQRVSGAFTSPYSPTLKRAIVSAIVDEGMKPREAVDRAAKGELPGVDKTRVPLGTARDWALKEKRDRALKDPGSIVTEYENARAELVHTLRAEVRRLREQRRAGGAIDLDRARQVARLADEVRPIVQHYRPRSPEKPEATETLPVEESPGSGLLSRLLNAERETGRTSAESPDRAEHPPSPEASAVRTPEVQQPEPVRTPSISDVLADDNSDALLEWVRLHNPAALQPRQNGQEDHEIQAEQDDHTHLEHHGNGNARAHTPTPRTTTMPSPAVHEARIRTGHEDTPPDEEHDTPPATGSPARDPRSLAHARARELARSTGGEGAE